MAVRNREIAGDERIEFRIGIYQRDIVVDGDDIFGDGVNIAARLEGMAEFRVGIHPGDIVGDGIRFAGRRLRG